MERRADEKKKRNTGRSESWNASTEKLQRHVFRLLYRDKSELLELYNAVNDTQYTNPEELEAAGLENAVYMSMKNDVSWVVDLRLNLYEHQSTVNPNMPLRDLFYIAKLYEKMIQKEKRTSIREKESRFRHRVLLYFTTGQKNSRRGRSCACRNPFTSRRKKLAWN